MQRYGQPCYRYSEADAVEQCLPGGAQCGSVECMHGDHAPWTVQGVVLGPSLTLLPRPSGRGQVETSSIHTFACPCTPSYISSGSHPVPVHGCSRFSEPDAAILTAFPQLREKVANMQTGSACARRKNSALLAAYRSLHDGHGSTCSMFAHVRGAS